MSFLLPVAIATSYFFNYYLVPRFLLKRKKIRFALYSLYTLVVSLYLQMVVITISFVVIANYNYREMDPVMANIFVLASIIYLIVFIKAFVLLYLQVMNDEMKVQNLIREKKALKKDFITVRANRKNRQVHLEDLIYMESLADYVKIHTPGNSITTKETISAFEDMLPDYFIRIHRSYIVNQHYVRSFSATTVNLNGTELPVSRTFKENTMARLSGTGN